MLDRGTTYRALLRVYDATGALANPLSASCVITLPDGTTAAPPVTLPPAQTGILTADYVTTQPGLHKAAWTTGTPGTAAVDWFNVRDFISIVSVAEVKAHLNMTSTGDDDELRNFMQAATELVESRAGACITRTVTERVEGSGWVLPLATRPVLAVTSVTSIWANGPTWGGAQITVDKPAGTIRQAMNGWPFWGGPWDITYTVGRAVIPERLQHAAKEQVRHLWETQRGAVQAPPLAGEDTSFTTTAGWSFSVPRRVIELLAQDQVPAI